jgi:hypothetical protein
MTESVPNWRLILNADEGVGFGSGLGGLEGIERDVGVAAAQLKVGGQGHVLGGLGPERPTGGGFGGRRPA